MEEKTAKRRRLSGSYIIWDHETNGSNKIVQEGVLGSLINCLTAAVVLSNDESKDLYRYKQAIEHLKSPLAHVQPTLMTNKKTSSNAIQSISRYIDSKTSQLENC